MLVLALVAGALASACTRDGHPRKRPNLLLISMDSTRRDRFGCYGNHPKHAPDISPTPNLDRLAGRGVRFENAYAPTSWTLPSHMSLLTGLAPLVHAVESDGTQLAPEVSTLAEILHRDGYRTAGFVSAPYLEGQYGFERGFERYKVCYGPALAGHLLARAESKPAKVHPANPGDEMRLRLAEFRERTAAGALYRLDTSSLPVTDATLRSLRELARSSEPWFLFAHYFDPHYDYVAPSPFDRLFDADYAGEIDGTHVLDDERISVPDDDEPGQRIRTASERDLEHLLARYDGEIAWTDVQIGRLLDELAALGLAENTLVVLTADHGDEFFEHAGLGHRRNLCEEVLRVPLILSWPGVLPSGRVVEGLVSNYDVLPTVLELFDLPAPQGLSGASLAALARGASTDWDRSIGARFVATRRGKLPLGNVPADPDATGTYVLESFYNGPIKITRELQWVTGASATTPPVERIRWIDLERFPGEPSSELRADFDDPRAREALQRFRSEYEQQLARRSRAGILSTDGDDDAALAALGYVDAAHPTSASSIDELRTPPPAAAGGEELPQRE